MIYSDLQAEVKRRAIRDQSGTEFDTAIKNSINSALFRLGREAQWRIMRRRHTFQTKTTYTTGTGACTVTNGSTAFSVTGATFITDGIEIGRYIQFTGSATYWRIATITSETSGTLTLPYDGTSTTTGSYMIMPQETYILPIQASHKMFMWHRAFGYPYKMEYIPEQTFYGAGVQDTIRNRPTHYHMWQEDMVREQILEPSVVTVVSSSASDTSQTVTVYGTVSGYPDYESIALTGTTPVVGSKTFSEIERVVKDGSTTGRVTVTANTGNCTLAVLPVGNTTTGITYSKVSLYPLPNTVFDMYVEYYKDPYKLVNDKDVHEFGQDFDEALICMAVAKIKFENSQAEGDKWFSLYKDEIKTLKRTNADKIDWFPTLEKSVQNRTKDGLIHSNLSYIQLGGSYGPLSRR